MISLPISYCLSQFLTCWRKGGKTQVPGSFKVFCWLLYTCQFVLVSGQPFVVNIVIAILQMRKAHLRVFKKFANIQLENLESEQN